MSCDQMQEMIALDAGGDLDAVARQRLGRHLASCPACRCLAAEMRQSRESLRRLADVPIGSDLLAEVRSTVLEEIAVSKRPVKILGFPVRRPGRRHWLAAAAALLLLAAAGWLASRGRQRPAPLPEIVRYEPSPVVTPSALELPIAPPLAEPTPAASASTEERPVVAETSEPGTTKTVEPTPPELRRSPEVIAEFARPPSQSTVVKWFVDDPDLVIYWLIESEQATEETNNEPKEA